MNTVKLRRLRRPDTHATLPIVPFALPEMVKADAPMTERSPRWCALPGRLSERTRAHDSGMSFARFRRSGYLHPGWGFGMTDRQFYLLLALLLLAVAAGEVVYAMVGPLSETTGQLGELSSINRVR